MKKLISLFLFLGMFSFPVFGNMENDIGLLKCVTYLPISCGVDIKVLQQTKKKDSDNKFLTFSVKVQCKKDRKIYPFTHVIPFSKKYKRYELEYYTTDTEPAPNFICFFESVEVEPKKSKDTKPSTGTPNGSVPSS